MATENTPAEVEISALLAPATIFLRVKGTRGVSELNLPLTVDQAEAIRRALADVLEEAGR